MTYTILLNGGKEIDVEHAATPQQMESVIKGFQGSAQWVKFITREGDYFIDSLAIQGFRPHESATATFGEPDKPATVPNPENVRPAKVSRKR